MQGHHIWMQSATLCVCMALAGNAAAQIQSGGEPTYRPAAPSADGLSPEDVVALPGTKWLIAGAGLRTGPSGRAGLSLIDTTNPANIQPLYPSPTSSDQRDEVRFEDCPGPLTGGLGPHGINVERLPDGSYNLVAVNHRGRESIEIFHIAQGGDIPRATWRGCVVLPGAASGNSVAPLPGGGGYIVTNFLQKNDPNYLQAMANGTATGNVLKWTPGAGWSDFVPQKFSGANGAEVTPDGRWVFISEWSDYKIWKFALQGDASPRTVHLDFIPDNLRLTGRGTILIAGQNADPVNVMTCKRTHDPCQASFTVLEMDPDTMSTHVLARGGDANFGGATGAAIVGSSLWISSYYSPKVAHYEPVKGR